MIIHSIKIENFKSIYPGAEFDFDSLAGLVKLSGPVGVGKTCLGEAILFGLFGAVREQNNGQLVTWNAKDCRVELNLTSKGREVHIVRSVLQPLEVDVDGVPLAASSKRNTQAILEDEIYDTPRMAMERMCIISFSMFNSLCSMTAYQTKSFIDDVFGFRLFTRYSEEIASAKKDATAESVKLKALYDENVNQTEALKEKKERQTAELASNTDLEKLASERAELIERGKAVKAEMTELENALREKDSALYARMTELKTLGRQEKEYWNKFKDGKCPTCGHDVDMEAVDASKTKMLRYAEDYKKTEAERAELNAEGRKPIDERSEEITRIKGDIAAIDSKIKLHNNSVKLISENYDALISEYETKAAETKELLDKTDIEIGRWNEMSELFTKTLRYSLLNTLVPHINKSIQHFINKLEQCYKVEFDQEFKVHIYTDAFDKEISYSNLSTGQKKTLDLAITFGILQNLMSTVNCNVIFLDELFSNMDADLRNIMLGVLKESYEGKTVFVINHAEMNDDHFTHKIRVSLANKRIDSKKRGEIISKVIQASKYEQLF